MDSIIGVLGWYCLFFGCYSIFGRIRWLIPIRKYVMLSMFVLSAACACYVYPNVWTGMFLAVMIIFSIWSFRKKPLDHMVVIDVPSDSYELRVEERAVGVTVQPQYHLIYNGTIYTIASPIEGGRPALTLYAKVREDTDIIWADVVVKQTRIFRRIETIALILAAFFLPICAVFMKECTFGITEEHFGILITFLFGGVGRKFFCGVKTVFYRCLYYFCFFLEIMGVIDFFIAMIQ